MVNYSKIFNLSFLFIMWFICISIIFNSSSEVTLQKVFLIGLFSVVVYGIQNIPIMSPIFFMTCFYIMLFFVYPLYMLLYKIESGMPFQIYHDYTLLTVSGIYLFMIGACSVYKKSKSVEIIVEIINLKKAIKILVVFMLIIVLLLFFDAKTINILSLSRMELKNAGSEIRKIANFGVTISSILFFLVGYTWKINRLTKNYIWIIFLVTMEVLFFLFFRTRTMPVAHISAFIAGFYFSHHTIVAGTKLIYNSYYKSFFATVKIWTMFIVLFVLSIISRFLRGYLEPGNSIQDFQTSLQTMISETIELGDAGYASVVMLMLQMFPDQYEFLMGQSYYRLLFTPIPRFIWPDKPINTESMIGSIVSPESQAYSLPPGIQGDLYINFGMWGILGMLLFGMFFTIISRFDSFFALLLSGVSAVWIFHLSRGGFTNPIIIFFVLFIAAKVIDLWIIKSDYIFVEKVKNKLPFLRREKRLLYPTEK